MARKRNYAAEYARRIARAKEKGYSKSVARGHARKGEAGIKAAKFLGVKAGADIDAIVAADARRVFGRKPKREFGEAPVQYEEKLIELKKREGRFEWTDEAAFIAAMGDLGMTTHDAYTFWFSP